MKNLLLLIMLLAISPVNLAVTRYSPTLTGAKQQSSTEFGKSGTLTKVDPQGKWIKIDGRKYNLSIHATDIEKIYQIVPGKKIFYNLEKNSKNNNSNVTRIWLENHDEPNL